MCTSSTLTLKELDDHEVSENTLAHAQYNRPN